MKFLSLLIAICCCHPLAAQDDFLAKRYFEDGDFDKALVFYKKLVDHHPRRPDYGERMVACYQQLERYQEASDYLLKQLEQSRAHPAWCVEMGRNYTLQGRKIEAGEYYGKALAAIHKNPDYGYAIGARFQKYALLDRALQAYQGAMDRNPKLDYSFQMARIHGEQGHIDKMFRAYLGLLREGRTSRSNVLRNIEPFITTDPQNAHNQLLKRILVSFAQQDPAVRWNQMLSWLFVQQRQWAGAFRQEKAIDKRTQGGNLKRLEALGEMALDAKDLAVAGEIYRYIEQQAINTYVRLNAQLKLIELQLYQADPRTRDKVAERFESLMQIYGQDPQSLPLQLAYARFLTFERDQPQPAIALLRKRLNLPLDVRQKAYAKLALGDILVFDQQFNQALIYFTQIQKSLKNDLLGQEARFKVAQTSFYKGDFDWALTQLKVLRGSSSQLIANDAMQLSLLISDNTLADSTQTALKKYARADLLAYRNKREEAVAALDHILEHHKGEHIEDEALLKQGELLAQMGAFAAAELDYLKITEFHRDGILADDAFFALGQLYRKVMDRPERAKEQYGKILYEYQDSYYYPEARKHFRTLRGDAVE